jgi:hypothetical protein
MNDIGLSNTLIFMVLEAVVETDVLDEVVL